MLYTLLFLTTLAILNIFAWCLAMPVMDWFGFPHNVGVLTRNGLQHAQTNLLGLYVALLCRRPAVGALVILPLAWLKMQWYEIIWFFNHHYATGSLPWGFLNVATLPFAVLALFHGLRLALGWRITCDPKLDARAGQFQTADLLEWMFTVASALGLQTASYTLFFQEVETAERVSYAIHMTLHMLTVVPLGLVLLSERPPIRWLIVIAITWVVLGALGMSWESWQETRSLWSTRVITVEFIQEYAVHGIAVCLAIVLNSWALRYWGYRWRGPLRKGN